MNQHTLVQIDKTTTDCAARRDLFDGFREEGGVLILEEELPLCYPS